MENVKRIYVEKKDAYAVKAKELEGDLKSYLGILDDQVGTILQGHACTGIFIHDGRFAALDKIAAHDDDYIVGAGDATSLCDMVGVAVVEGIVFCDDACNFHRGPFFGGSKKNRFLSNSF